MSYSHQQTLNNEKEGLINDTFENNVCENQCFPGIEKSSQGHVDDVNINKLNVLEEKGNPSEEPAETSILRRVSFPKNDDELVTGYMEPANPWTSAVQTVSELTELYKGSCEKHNVKPLQAILDHLETLDLSIPSRCSSLSLKNKKLSPEDCEALEEIFKRVQYRFIDISCCGLSDIAASALFDMIEFYEAANELDISDNPDITARGWQSCISMIRRSRALQILNARGNPISEMTAKSLGKSLNTSCLTILKLEHCGLTGRPITSLCNEIRRNTSLKELWLANNDLSSEDARKIGELLVANLSIQFLDISNNMIKDSGLKSIVRALIQQSSFIPKEENCIQEMKKKPNIFEYVQSEELDAIDQKLKCFLNGRSMLDALLNMDGTQNISNSDEHANKGTHNFRDGKNNCAESSESNIESAKISETQNLNANESLHIILPDQENSAELQIIKKCDIPIDFAHPGNNNLKFHRNKDLKCSDDMVIETSNLDENRNENFTNETEMSCVEQNRSVEAQKVFFQNEGLHSISSNAEAHENEASCIDHNFFLANFEVSKANDMSQNKKSGDPINGNRGLQGIVLWNNSITRISGEYISDLLATTNSLEFLNIGKNVLSNEFIQKVKESLKENKTLINLGLQSAHLTGEGVKLLSSVLQFGGNSTLQRIDIRDNNVQVNGLMALADSLKSNKSITRIDIDDIPKRLNEEEGESQFYYSRALQSVRTLCARNFMPQESTSNSKHKYHASRKISLTCQSLGPPLIDAKKNLKPEINVLDSKKKSSSRLRSPLPSPPIISPSSSPVPSPSRSRFQVFRVVENGRTVPSISISNANTQNQLGNEKSNDAKNFPFSSEENRVKEKNSTSEKEVEVTNTESTTNTSQNIIPNFANINISKENNTVELCNMVNDLSGAEFGSMKVLRASNDPKQVIPVHNLVEKDNFFQANEVNEENQGSKTSNSQYNEPSEPSQSARNDQLNKSNESLNQNKLNADLADIPIPRTTCLSDANCPNTVDKLLNFIQHPVQIFAKSTNNDNIAGKQMSDCVKQNTGTNIFKWNRLETVVTSAPSIINTATKQFRDIADFGRYVFKQNIALGESVNVANAINISEMDSSGFPDSGHPAGLDLHHYLLEVKDACDSQMISNENQIKDHRPNSRISNTEQDSSKVTVSSTQESKEPSVLNSMLTSVYLADDHGGPENVNDEERRDNSSQQRKSECFTISEDL